jgi:hypothetical protein
MLVRARWNMRICGAIALTPQLCPIPMSCADQELSPLLHGHVQDTQVPRLYMRHYYRSREGRGLLQQILYASLPFCTTQACTCTNTKICAYHTRLHTQLTHERAHKYTHTHKHMWTLTSTCAFTCKIYTGWHIFPSRDGTFFPLVMAHFSLS